MQELHGERRGERRLLGGLGDYGVARRECRAQLSGKDRERKIPRTDAGKDSAPAQAQRISLSGRARQQRLGGKQHPRLLRVVAQEIDRLAHLGDAVRQRLARLEYAARDELGTARLKELRRPLKHRGALLCTARFPGRGRSARAAERALHIGGGGLHDGTNRLRLVGRIEELQALTAAGSAIDERRRPPRLRGRSLAGVFQALKLRRIGEIDAQGIQSSRTKETLRHIDARMCRLRQPIDLRDRIRDDGCRRQPRIDHAIHEGRIGAIFEQAPHQIRQQILVRPDRCVYAAGIAARIGGNHLRIQLLAHAMQTLEFECAGTIAEELRDVRNGMRVVRGELREDHVGRRGKQARTGKIGHVRVRLAREHGVAGKAAFLRALDFAVPVSALDQTHREHAPECAGARYQPFEQPRCAFLIGLYRKTKSAVCGEILACEHRIDEQQRQLQALGLLGVDRKSDAGVAREPDEREQLRRKLLEHTRALRELVPRVQCRELDGNTVARGHRDLGPDRAADRDDRRAVLLEVVLGVDLRQRRLAQHVK